MDSRPHMGRPGDAQPSAGPQFEHTPGVNIARHSGASTVSICLRLPPAADAVELTIADDGRGFAMAAAGDHFGLDIMQERTQAVGAALRVASAPGQGTRVTAVWPAPTPAQP